MTRRTRQVKPKLTDAQARVLIRAASVYARDLEPDKVAQVDEARFVLEAAADAANGDKDI